MGASQRKEGFAVPKGIAASETRGDDSNKAGHLNSFHFCLGFRLVSPAGSLDSPGGPIGPPADPSTLPMRGGKPRGLIVVRIFVHYMYESSSWSVQKLLIASLLQTSAPVCPWFLTYCHSKTWASSGDDYGKGISCDRSVKTVYSLVKKVHELIWFKMFKELINNKDLGKRCYRICINNLLTSFVKVFERSRGGLRKIVHRKTFSKIKNKILKI